MTEIRSIADGEKGSESRPYFISVTAPEDASMIAFGALKSEKVDNFYFQYSDMVFRISSNGEMNYLKPEDKEKNDGITLNNLKDGLISGLIKKLESSS